MYIHTYTYIHIYVCIYIYIHIYIFTHTHSDQGRYQGNFGGEAGRKCIAVLTKFVKHARRRSIFKCKRWLALSSLTRFEFTPATINIHLNKHTHTHTCMHTRIRLYLIVWRWRELPDSNNALFEKRARSWSKRAVSTVSERATAHTPPSHSPFQTQPHKYPPQGRITAARIQDVQGDALPMHVISRQQGTKLICRNETRIPGLLPKNKRLVTGVICLKWSLIVQVIHCKWATNYWAHLRQWTSTMQLTGGAGLDRPERGTETG